MTDLMNKLAAVVAAASLAITLVAAGFAACAAFPQTTEMLAEAFSGNGNPGTPFSHDELVQAAVATRDYTVGSNDREAVFSMLHAINESAGTPYADAAPDELAAAPEEYTLPADALSHLDDVYHVVAGARIGLIVVALVAVAACAHMAVRVGRRALGGVLMARASRSSRCSRFWPHGWSRTSTASSPPSTRCSSRTARGRSPTTRCSSPCTRPSSG